MEELPDVACSVAVLDEDVACSVAVLCSSGPVPCFVAAADVEVDHTDLIALLVE